MKKILGLVLVFIYFVSPVFAAEPISQEILDQARAQAGLFMDLKNALGLDWLDKYNAYLEDPDSSSKPSWESSVTALINKNYLSSSFPTDFQITPTGQEVTISRTITNQGIKNALPIYLPSVVISGDTVSLLVQRPAQWVAWEAGLNSKISRDGGDDPDVLPDASLEFGAGSKIEFVNNDGKLVGIDSLTYKGQELEDRFINTDGDNMSGDLYIKGNIVWHAGNDGSGSGLDADLLDGQDGSYYLAAENLTGIVPLEKLAGTYNIDISGKASTATYASDSDKLDGYDSSHFATAGHTHSYVSIGGDTMIGTLNLPNLEVQSGGSVKFYSESGASTISTDQSGNLNLQANKVTVPSKMDVGGLKITDIYARDVFGWKSSIDLSGSNVGIRVPDQNILLGFNDKGGITVVDTTNGAPLFELDRKGQLYVNRNKVWHAGNDGSGSGLDADLLDGFDSSAFIRYVEIPAGADLNDYTSVGFYFNGMTVNAQTMKNIPQPEAFYMVVLGAGTCVQIFFPHSINNSTRKFYIRRHDGYINYWSPWSYVNLDGEQPTYNPGTWAYIDLADNPIDVSEFLSKPELISFSEVTDETGTYKMWKYKQVFSNPDVYAYVKSAFMSQIKARTGLSAVEAIGMVATVTPQINGNILAAGAVYIRLKPHLAIPYVAFGYDFYNSISTAKDMVGKTQDIVSSNQGAGDVISFEIYTMKSSYQYGSTYFEAQSKGQLLITGAWGRY